MHSYQKISIVTVCLNSVSTIEDTIRSVISQNYPNLEYIIIDGGSNDGTIDIIRRYEQHLAYWISEKDEGFGFALQKGFARSTGEIMAYINADDMYHPGAFHNVATIFRLFPKVQWLMGFPTLFNKEGVTFCQILLPWTRWSRHRFYNNDLMAIQQESTFWKRELWEQSGASIDLQYKLAVDIHLWFKFFRHEQLYTTTIPLAGFRYNSPEQISIGKRKEYLEECGRMLKEERAEMSIIALINTKLRWLVAQPFKLFFGFNFPWLTAVYCQILQLPDLIFYDFKENQFVMRKQLK